MKLLTKREAAAFCRVSLAAFDSHVRPTLSPKRIGRRVLFLQEDLEAWAESPSRDGKTKPGRSPASPPKRSGTPGSPLLVALLSDPRAQETMTRLTRKPRSSLQPLEPASSEQSTEHSAVVLPFPSRSS